MTFSLIVGNATDVLRAMPKETVDMCITSPPYWTCRDYHLPPVVYGGSESCEHDFVKETNPNGRKIESEKCTKCSAWKGQLGMEQTPDEYVKHLCSVFDLVYSVITPSGSCWVNMGDTYAQKDISPNIKKKSLCQIPSLFALEMTRRGWILRNEIIWHKPNAMPCSVRDRFTIDFEKLFFFTKTDKYYFNQQKEPLRCPQAISVNSPNKHELYETPTYSGFKWDASKHDGRNMRAVWSIPTSGSSINHIAMFPEELIKVPIDACCPKGGVVLDPFCGSGTTLAYCEKMGISSIGIELNSEYVNIIRERLDSKKI